MIRSLYLSNFKAFADTDGKPIPIRPITLIFGPNSAGKSSLIHSLLLANHAINTGELDAHLTELGGTSVDLGGFRQYVHRHQTDRTVRWGVTLDSSQLPKRSAEFLIGTERISVTVELGMEQEEVQEPVEIPGTDRIVLETIGYRAVGTPHVLVYEIAADGETLLRMSRRPEGYLQVDSLNTQHAVIDRILRTLVEGFTTTTISDDDLQSLRESVSELLPKLRSSADRLVPDELHEIDGASYDDDRSMLLPVPKAGRDDALSKAMDLFLPRKLNHLVSDLHDAVADSLDRFVYLGPLRSSPPRHLAYLRGTDPNWQAGGGRAWDVLLRNTTVRDRVNRWLKDPRRLSTPYRVEVQRQILAGADKIHDLISRSLDDVEQAIMEGLESVEIERGEYDLTSSWDAESHARALHEQLSNPDLLEGHDDLVLVDIEQDITVSLPDVGVGISQVMPVLVYAFESEQRLLAIEQPEIHVHPALQAELGDVFIESALGPHKNTFLIETHSEHLILRILRRIRETTDGELEEGQRPIRPDDVAVLYVDPRDRRTAVVEIPVTDDGDFATQWPAGFFTEREKELF